MKNLLRLTVLAAALAGAAPASAGNNVYSWTGSQVIPDNNANGVAFTFYLSTPSPELISSVSVNLNLTGGWNGDLFAYLSHGSGYAVLLNRIGRTSQDLAGAHTSGMNVSFSDSYATDIHTYGGDPVVGNFSPDGRGTSPYAVLDTDARTALLSSFRGLNSGGFWTLYIADVSPLGVSTLESWSVNISTAPVPEPSTLAFVGLAACGLLVQRRRR